MRGPFAAQSIADVVLDKVGGALCVAHTALIIAHMLQRGPLQFIVGGSLLAHARRKFNACVALTDSLIFS